MTCRHRQYDDRAVDEQVSGQRTAFDVRDSNRPFRRARLIGHEVPRTAGLANKVNDSKLQPWQCAATSSFASAQAWWQSQRTASGSQRGPQNRPSARCPRSGRFSCSPPAGKVSNWLEDDSLHPAPPRACAVRAPATVAPAGRPPVSVTPAAADARCSRRRRRDATRCRSRLRCAGAA